LILRRISGAQNGLELGNISLLFTPSWLQKIEAFKVQFAYGQREILIDYAGLDKSALLMGILQHGLSYMDDPTEAATPRLRNFRRSPLWVYSERKAKFLSGYGHRNVRAIGAPWLYLPPASKSPTRQLIPERYIVFPIHTSLSINVSPDANEIRNKIKFWKSIAGDSQLTICLFWSDFLELSWRSVAESEGVMVTVVGVGETPPQYWSPHSARVDFLTNLRTILSQNSHAIFETFTSAMFYAISTGLKVGYFPQAQLEIEFQLHGQADRWITENMSMVLGQFADPACFDELTNEMLGVESFRSPSELQELLSWEVGLVPLPDL
jgi:hypothetical protein